MGSRTVRLDEDSERILAEIVRAKKLSVSTALKQGLIALRESLWAEGPTATPYAVYRTIDLGKGGGSRASGRNAKAALRALLRNKSRS